MSDTDSKSEASTAVVAEETTSTSDSNGKTEKKAKTADGAEVTKTGEDDTAPSTSKKGGKGKGRGKAKAAEAKEKSVPLRRGRSASKGDASLAAEIARANQSEAKAEKKTAEKKEKAKKEPKEAKEKKAAPAKAKGKAKSKGKGKGKGSKKAATAADDEVEAETNGDETKATDGESKEEKKSTTSTETNERMAKEMAAFPVVKLASFLSGGADAAADDCKTIARLLHEYGFLLVEDPRVDHKENEVFIDTLENYYGQPEEVKAADIRKDLHYQVGITPAQTEKARDHCERVSKLPKEEKPQTLCPPERDNKLRFFWRIGGRPTHTEFKQLNAEPVIPKAFPQWPQVMDRWGNLILSTVHTVTEMAAAGFNLPTDTFTKLLNLGPHLLAPTGSDFNKFGALGTTLASFHYDLNFMTIHGRSRFPGLFIWTRDQRKLLVKVPERCLLLQAGKQFEWLTGGHVLAGFHEVVVAPETVAAIDRARAAGKSLWRVSSTLFSHVASDNTLEPLAHFATDESRRAYPATKAGTQVQNELNAIKLGAEELAMGAVAAQ